MLKEKPILPAVERLAEYTGQVLSFILDGARDILPPAEPNPDTPKWAARLVRAWSRERRPNFLLLGLWQTCLAAELRRLLPDDVLLVVSDVSPEAVRAALAQPEAAVFSHPSAALLCDTSAWAQRLLLDSTGIEPASVFAVINPLLPAAKRDPYHELERLLALRKAEVARSEKDAPSSLSLAIILHPAEPGLAEFFAAIPTWVEQICVLWDASEPPSTSALGIPPDPRRIDAAHPLAGDFAAQRNRALGLCRGEWVLSLDGDERLPVSLWAALPALMARQDVAGYYFQRQTLYPDASSCKMGYGLWPDLQFRLFRSQPGIAYQRPVHEILEGLSGTRAVLAAGAIEHYNRLNKTPEELRRKLSVFDGATGGAWGHRLNTEYPSLARALLPSSELEFPARLFMLP
ncbi:hypothetical protein [Desulfocurvibacter africanus]|nr:hypothetical protein [Desulfocurvibacter africanus]